MMPPVETLIFIGGLFVFMVLLPYVGYRVLRWSWRELTTPIGEES